MLSRRTLLSLLAAAGRRRIQYGDLPAALLGLPRPQFAALVRSIEQSTAARLRDGEHDHIIYYILQSRRFTRLPPIEPAVSARDNLAEPPPAVIARMRDFLQVLGGPDRDERLDWFRRLLPPPRRSLAVLSTEYARAMRFLREKEFGPGGARLYQQRGHSSDTQIEAGFAVATALGVLKALDPRARLERVLIAGPGLDFAPRTALIDSHPPQSYQPFAVADALLGLGLARRGALHVHCVDINDRVVEWLKRRGERRLRLPGASGDAACRAWQEQLGASIGHRDGDELTVSFDNLTAERLNIITWRLDANYDLAVATNVLLYFGNQELLLALANIQAMLRPGGWFIHNELRPEVESYSRALGFPVIQARTLRIGEGAKRPLFDAFVLQRKR